MSADPVEPLTREADLERMLAEPLVVIYKHSPRCGICRGTLIEVRQFAAAHRDVPVYLVDVIAHRPLSQRLADRLAVRHQSPQVILVLEGRAVWNASHYRVSATRLDAALADARAESER